MGVLRRLSLRAGWQLILLAAAAGGSYAVAGDATPAATSRSPTTAPAPLDAARARRDALRTVVAEGAQAHVLAMRWLEERQKRVPDAASTYAVLQKLWRWRSHAEMIANGQGELLRAYYLADPGALSAAVGELPPPAPAPGTDGPPAGHWQRLSAFLAANTATLDRRFASVATTLSSPPELVIADLKAAAELELLEDVLRTQGAVAPPKQQ